MTLKGSETNLIWQNIDPRLKIVWVTIFSFYLASVNDLKVLLASLIFGLIFSRLSDFSFKEIIQKLKPINFFILFFWIILPFTTPGPQLHLKWFNISQTGLELCLVLTVKANSLMLFFIAFILSLPTSTLAYALQKLKVSPKLVYLFLFAYRYLFLLKEEKEKLMRSLKIKGFTPKTNLFTYKIYAYLLGLLILRAYEKGDRAHKALLLRGFNGTFYSLYVYKLTAKDFYCSLVFFLVLILFIWMM
ncbi:MAG: energy-coupling factor transporter transmembrane component T [Desulfonauticus sp.]|nr:energy-coupling factor transporter transmembrane component T [Desulfonauticus sp.]